ncbi:hypothetical protein [Virgibacillus sediminis]|uniref:Uncharacterized protein n=1 Tax=Virgibacillus sediminis TaxID=202260 RepID=A0ABV7A1K9_9BACI
MKSKIIILILFLFTLIGVAGAWFWMQHLTNTDQVSSSATAVVSGESYLPSFDDSPFSHIKIP